MKSSFEIGLWVLAIARRIGVAVLLRGKTRSDRAGAIFCYIGKDCSRPDVRPVRQMCELQAFIGL